MAENKKSVILYTDLIHTFEALTDAQAGRLIKHFFRYVNDKNPESPDKITQIAFEPIKQQLKRDLQKWDKERKNRSDAGKKGMAKRWKSKSKITDDNSVMPDITNITDNVNGNVNVNVINTIPPQSGIAIFNAEELILKNQIEFERICMTAKKMDTGAAKDSLRKFHLHLESNAKYPQSKKQLFAGFEKWLMNEPKFNQNGSKTNWGTNADKPKLGTSDERMDRLKKW